MEKVSIVILNYLNYADTIECVESISIDNYPNREVIVVDNGSPNESREVLEAKFENTDGVHLLFSDRNEGFARGNNIGIRYAREKLGSSFVLVVNNDTIFKDPCMVMKLMGAYEPGVGVIGPRILSADGVEQNPVRMDRVRENSRQNFFYRKKILRLMIRKHPVYQQVNRLFGNEKKKRIRFNRMAQADCCSEKLVLHGACMLLTKDYFKYYPYLFPQTFLYFEEDILAILIRKAGLHNKFVCDASIYHKEDQSSEMSFGNSDVVKYKHLIESMNMARVIYPIEYPAITERYFNLP